MPELPSHGKAALVTGSGGEARLGFSELSARVSARAEELGRASGLAWLNARPDAEFVVDFLAHLEAGRPVAILPGDWSPSERKTREEFLLRHASAVRPETALILFTSGSTGSFKAVELTRAGIEANTRAVLASLDFARAEEQALYLPLSYSFGLLGQLLPAVRAGVTTRLLGDFTQALAFAEPAKMRGMWSGVATHWEAWARVLDGRGPFPGVTHVVSAGAYLRPAIKEKLRALFPAATLYNCYGQTEASPRILCLDSRDSAFFAEVVGRPVPGIETRLDAEGFLEVRGPQVMAGYLGDDEGTRERLRDGWLRTGDLAAIDADGRVQIRGRRDDLVKIAGERISCSEVERELGALEGVKEAVVLPVDHPAYGAVLGAVVVGSAEGAADAAVEKKLARAMSERVSPRKVPRLWWFRSELPRNANGKIDRAALAAWVKEEAG